MLFSFVVKATSISDLDFSVTLVTVSTSCDITKVEQKALSAWPSGSPPIRLPLRSSIIITFEPCSKESTNVSLKFSKTSIGASDGLLTVQRKTRVKSFTLHFQPYLLIVDFRHWGPFFNDASLVFNIDEYSAASLVWPSILPEVVYPGIRISASHTERSSNDSETVKISTFLVLTVCLRKYKFSCNATERTLRWAILSCLTLIYMYIYIHVFDSFLLLSWAGIQLYIAP